MTKLTEDQITEIKNEIIDLKNKPIDKIFPVRFMYNGQCISSLKELTLQPKGINVIYQTHYWNFTKQTALKIANWIGCKAVFSE